MQIHLTPQRGEAIKRATIARRTVTVFEGSGQVQWPFVAIPIGDYYAADRRHGIRLARELHLGNFLPLRGQLVVEFPFLERWLIR